MRYLILFLFLITTIDASPCCNEIDMRGEVLSIQQYTYADRAASYIQVILKTAKEEIAVDLGLKSYLKFQGMVIAPHDKIEVKGCLKSRQGVTIVEGVQIKKGKRTLTIAE